MNQLNLTPMLLFMVIVGYFAVLSFISFKTSQGANNLDFFNGSKKSPWYMVAFGMVGATLSGVTFLSLPGSVYSSSFSYIQMIMGYAFGYLFIIVVLLPLYYRRNLISIYGYLNQRFGFYSHKTGSVFFIISRIIGASFRMYLMTMVLHDFIFIHFGIPFWLTVLISLLLIWSYTVKAGIKTIIWTDTLQTLFMITAIVVAFFTITTELNIDLSTTISTIRNSEYSQVFFFEGGWSDKLNFFKLFLGGAFMAIVMTGLDQDMMQKNLSCKNVKESQKNMKWFFVVLVIVNIMIMALGALLYIYSAKQGIDLPLNAETGKVITDKVFPNLALNHLPAYIGIIFLIGLLAAAYSSADSALTSLTTSFCVDILDKVNTPKSQRILIHIGFTIALFVTIVIFRYFMEASAINNLFRVAGFTYGPILGLFAFGLLTKTKVKDKFVPLIAIAAPITTYLIDINSQELLNGYTFGFELLLLNGLLMFAGLVLISNSQEQT